MPRSAPARKTPKVSRPFMPGYDMMFRKGKKPIPWIRASRLFASSHNYWLATTSPDSVPHVMPIWGIWLDNQFYFSTGPRSRKARNLARNPKCTICNEKAEEAMILRGTARKMAKPTRNVLDSYKEKYDWKLDENDPDSPIFVVKPDTLYGIVEDGGSNPTRWHFR